MRKTRAVKPRPGYRLIEVSEYAIEVAQAYVAASADHNRHYDTVAADSFESLTAMLADAERLQKVESELSGRFAHLVAREIVGDEVVGAAKLKDHPEPGSRMFERHARKLAEFTASMASVTTEEVHAEVDQAMGELAAAGEVSA